jgi:hypothetical protein
MQNELDHVITTWFAKRHRGLILPDGWLGRPYAEQVKLTVCTLRPVRLIIELNQQLYLILSDAELVSMDEDELKLSFTRLIFDWRYSGRIAKDDLKMYEEGTLIFASVW